MTRGKEVVKRMRMRRKKMRSQQRRRLPRRLPRGKQHLLGPRDQRAAQMRTLKKKKHQVMEVVQIMSLTSP